MLQLIVYLEDDNDNAPVFELSTYTNVTSEGTPVNSLLFSGKTCWTSHSLLDFSFSDGKMTISHMASF